MRTPIEEGLATKIYQILVEECAAPQRQAAGFVSEFSGDDPASEWRFQGALGYGGKFYFPECRVDCYSEDSTGERREMIWKANRRIEALTEKGEVHV